MYFKQFYLGCLAHASYLIGSVGEAAVVDPQRDVEQYITEAKAQNLEIKYVVETHLHADFVSGHVELAARTGAEIVFGYKAGAAFPHRAVKDKDEIKIGQVTLHFIETPGHTPESISILVINTETSDESPKVLTGDTLFIGDVGRPDLVGADGYTAEMMAGMLYDSLHEKLLKLGDSVEVYPAHGAGSMCGRNISKETSSTIGEQRKFNYALRAMPKSEFVKMMTSDLPETPRYFPMDRKINRKGAVALDNLPVPPALAPAEVNKLAGQNAFILLDVREAEAFGKGHLPGSLNVGLKGQFATWAGSLISSEKSIIIIADDERSAREAVMRLARVGLENVAGYLAGGTTRWNEAGFDLAVLPQLSVDELHRRMNERHEAVQIVDVRRPAEYTDGHIPGAINISLAKLEEQFDDLDSQRPTAVVCAGGYRSSAAASLLERKGFRHLYNVVGGTGAWVNAGFQKDS